MSSVNRYKRHLELADDEAMTRRTRNRSGFNESYEAVQTNSTINKSNNENIHVFVEHQDQLPSTADVETAELLVQVIK